MKYEDKDKTLNMERSIRLTEKIFKQYAKIYNDTLREFALDHSARVDAFMELLCVKRHLPRDLGKAAAVLHDAAKFLDNHPKEHAKLGAIKARTILEETKDYSADEIDLICEAIANHSNKTIHQDPFSEALKDADALWSASPSDDLSKKWTDRIQSALIELAGNDAKSE